MAQYQTVETEQIAATSTAKYAEFEGGVNKVYIRTSDDCYIDFDQPAVSSRSFFIDASIDHPTEFNFGKNHVKKVWAITSGGSVTVYIVAVRE